MAQKSPVKKVHYPDQIMDNDGKGPANFTSDLHITSPSALSQVTELLFIKRNSSSTSLLMEERKGGLALLSWAIPLFLLCNATVVVYLQLITRGATKLELRDNGDELLQTNVKEYNDFSDVQTIFEAKAYVLGLLLGWSSLVWPHLLHGLLVLIWITPMSRRFRSIILPLMALFARMLWVGTLNSGIVALAFHIVCIIRLSPSGDSDISLRLFETAAPESNTQYVCYFLAIATAQWMLCRDRHWTHVSGKADVRPIRSDGDDQDSKQVTIAPTQSNAVLTSSKNPILPTETWDDFILPDIPYRLSRDEWEAVGWRQSPNEAMSNPSNSPESRLRQRYKRLLIFWGMLAVAIALSILMLFGASTTFARIKLTGLAESLSPANEDTRDVSLINFPKHASEDIGSIYQIWTTRLVYIVLLQAAPIACGILALALWITPAPRRWQRRTLVVLEILSMWQCLDMWYIVSAVTLLSFRILCDALLSDISPCTSLQVVTNDPCFQLSGELTADAWWLLAGSVLFNFTMIMIVRRSHAVLDDVTFTDSFMHAGRVAGFKVSSLGSESEIDTFREQLLGSKPSSPRPRKEFEEDVKLENDTMVSHTRHNVIAHV